MASCIKDEASNAEADITGISFEEDVLASARFNLNPSYNDNLQAYPILVKVKEGTPLNKLSPLFELTPGATISPKSGSEHDFSDGKRVKYTVTSENKAWQRVYSIGVREQSVSDIPNEFHFEDIRLINGINPKYKYQEFYEEQDGLELTWASGNEGFNWAASSSATENYPTSQHDNGKNGKCAKLETRLTGSLGAMVGMPIAAGNLFIGEFDMTNALTSPLKATHFGTPFCYKPSRLKGWYKYKAGERFYENGGYTDRKDVMNIYAIFYEGESYNEAGEVTEVILDGNLPNQNYEHPSMVALALISNPHETDDWEAFDIPFDYQRYGKEIDETKLAKGKYKLIGDNNKEVKFEIDESGKVIGNVKENTRETRKLVSTAVAELIIMIQTGIEKVNYIMIILTLLVTISSLLYIVKKTNVKES